MRPIGPYVNQKFRFISILARINLKSGDSGWSYEKFRILNSGILAEYKVPNINHNIFLEPIITLSCGLF